MRLSQQSAACARVSVGKQPDDPRFRTENVDSDPAHAYLHPRCHRGRYPHCRILARRPFASHVDLADYDATRADVRDLFEQDVAQRWLGRDSPNWWRSHIVFAVDVIY